MKTFNCFWSHSCGETHVCCTFCKKKNCEWRCNDSAENCKFKDCDEVKRTVEVFSISDKTHVKCHNELVSKTVQEKLRKYKKDKKLHNDGLADEIGVNEQVVQKVTSKSSVIKIRSDSYRKIKDFVVSIKNAEKRRLW